MKTVTYDETKYKLMPIEPTSEMLVRGGEEFFDSARNWKIGSTLRDQDHASMIYEGMLAVAATPPAVEQPSAQDREDAAYRALRELVLLKNIKDRMDRSQPITTTEVEEYRRRKPAAWEAARAVIARKEQP